MYWCVHEYGGAMRVQPRRERLGDYLDRCRQEMLATPIV
jgi:hypothetical protein